MTIPPTLLGVGCVILGLLLTFVFPIQRGRLNNQVWDFITLALFVAGAHFIRYYDLVSNLVIGVIAGFAAIIIRDFRLWLARFKGQVYRSTHRYHWYGRARDWYGQRRRRRRW